MVGRYKVTRECLRANGKDKTNKLSVFANDNKVLKCVQCALCAQQMTQLKISNLIVTEEPLLLGLKRLEHQD